MFFTLLVAVLAGSSIPAPIPDAFALRGRVTDSSGVPLAEVRVIILEASRSTRTNADGRYLLSSVPDGTYGVSFSAIGYRPRVIRVTIRGQDVNVDVALTPTIVELPAIQTTATPLATSALESPQPLAVLQGEALGTAQAASLGAVLNGLPGMRNYSTGSGIGKPVIRGLTSNRVLVLENGLRTESQQWGDEHAPNVETATAERIEVVRGPASVLYGSDALGGVINVIQRELPDATGQRGFVHGSLSGGYATNGSAPDGALLIEGAHGAVGFRGTMSGRSQDDIATPSGALFNSGLGMTSGSLALGVRGGWGSLAAIYSRRGERVEIHEDPADEPDATPFQRIGAGRATVTGNFALGQARLEVDLGYEQNRRREFEGEGSDVVALGLHSRTTTGNVHLHHSTGGRLAGVVGVSVMRTDVGIFGEEVLVPETTTDNAGVYAFEQLDAGRWQFSAGARYDYRRLDNSASDELGLEAGQRTWSSLTGNMGVLYRVSETVAAVGNIGRGFRAPSAFELFANGVHEGTVRFEVGDPGLGNETSLNGDLALRMQGHGVQAEVGVFRNAINDYIYPDPTGAVDIESDLQIYNITQGDALLTGVEAAFDLHLTGWLHLRGGADYTRGHNTTTDQPLAFVAPLRATYSARVELTESSTFREPYLQLGGESNARQSRLDPDDIAPRAYTLANFAAGTGLVIGPQHLQLDLQVHNIFDTSYRAFLSRYKRYADDAGRSVAVRVMMSF